MKATLHRVSSLLFALSLASVFGLSSCERKSETEKAADEVGDKIEDAADEVGDAVDDATD